MNENNTFANNPQPTEKPVALIGLDWGTNTSCIQGIRKGADRPGLNETIPTIVGYAKEGLVPGILPGDAETLFGKLALKHRLHLRLVQPLKNGIIDDAKAAKDFIKYVRSLVDTSGGAEVRVVIGVPANAGKQAREAVRTALTGVVDKLILIPEPFLAALGYRNEKKLADDDYIDPVSNSILIDIGGGSTDLCKVQGYYPQLEDQISIPFAGDAVDELLAREIEQKYPDSNLSMVKIREFKEQFAYVGQLPEKVIVKVNIGGKMRDLDIGEQVGIACEALLNRIFDKVRELIARADSDSIPELMQNILLTGGGSLVHNIAPRLQHLLEQDGYDKPVVKTLGRNYKEFVARGALKAALGAKDRQWQNLIN